MQPKWNYAPKYFIPKLAKYPFSDWKTKTSSLCGLFILSLRNILSQFEKHNILPYSLRTIHPQFAEYPFGLKKKYSSSVYGISFLFAEKSILYQFMEYPFCLKKKVFFISLRNRYPFCLKKKVFFISLWNILSVWRISYSSSVCGLLYFFSFWKVFFPSFEEYSILFYSQIAEYFPSVCGIFVFSLGNANIEFFI